MQPTLASAKLALLALGQVNNYFKAAYIGMKMNLDRVMFLFAGAMVLVSVVLTVYVHDNFIWLTVFVGANLVQASFTKFCPAAKLFKLLGVKSGEAFK